MTTARARPAVILLVEDNPDDLGCSSCVRKPVGREELARAIESIEDYWFEIVVLPPGER